MFERWGAKKRLAIAPNQSKHFTSFKTYFLKCCFLQAHGTEIAILKGASDEYHAREIGAGKVDVNKLTVFKLGIFEFLKRDVFEGLINHDIKIAIS